MARSHLGTWTPAQWILGLAVASGMAGCFGVVAAIRAEPEFPQAAPVAANREPAPRDLAVAGPRPIAPESLVTAAAERVEPPSPPLPELPPLTRRQIERVREIAERNPELDAHQFAKVGDSMTVSRGYLRCFAGGEGDWGLYRDLEDTVTHFRKGGRGPDPFLRESEAAGVGWSVRRAIHGSWSPLRRELHALRPRFATVMFGTNDIESRSPRRFAQRMWRLLEQLEEDGVVPVVSTIPPQRRGLAQRRWVARYNMIIRALTEGRDLPLLDIHRDFVELPRLGLAGDGIHANAYRPERRSQACDFSERALQFGHNVRNLRTLQQLQRVLRVVQGDAPSDRQAARALTRPPTKASRRETILTLPHASVRTLPGDAMPFRHQVRLEQPGELRVLAVPRSGAPLRILVEQAAPPGTEPRYRRSRRTDWGAPLQAGLYTITVSPSAEGEGPFAFTVQVFG